MKYWHPSEVVSPKDYVKNVEVILDAGDGSDGNEPISIAKLEWEGSPCFGIRWNIARREYDDEEKKKGARKCVGMPSSHGYPVWFIIPDDIVNPKSKVFELIRSKI